MIQVIIVFDTKNKWSTFRESWIFQKFILPITNLKECMWFAIEEVED